MTRLSGPNTLRILILAAAGALLTLQAAFAQSPITLTHVHGLAYSADGKQLMVPSHHGLAVFAGGKWAMAPGPQHDYMGFAATRTRLYSSGHPAPGSGLVNPFGLIRSTDGGKNWDRLGLQGESDFHALAAGWNTNTVYVWNPAPNSRMPRPGLHYTLNDGFQWQRAETGGLKGEPHALATHPDDAKTVAVATSAGVYLSRDAGANFRPVAQGVEGLAVHFDLDGQHVWYAGYAGAPRLARIALGNGQITLANLPALQKDAIAYIAQNPADRKEFAIATFERSIFISKDVGRNWTQVANRGSGL